MNDSLLARRARLRFIAVLVGMLAAAWGGYVGFVGFVESGGPGGIGLGVMGLATATGFASFFSPCSFPMLLTFLVRQHEDGSRKRAVVSLLSLGLGAVVFFGLVAVLLSLLGQGLGQVIGFDTAAGRAFRGFLGAFLLLLGLRQAHLIKARFRIFDTIARTAGRAFDTSDVESSAKRDFLYGFGYVLAGFG